MNYLKIPISRNILIDESACYYWNNENTNTLRNGTSWEKAWRDGEGTVGSGKVSFFKATDTPYRMVLNNTLMSNETIYCDCTGNGFERGAKRADFRSSNTFNFSNIEDNLYLASVPDIKTGARTGAYNLDYDGHYIFSETLNYEGAWGVWHVTEINGKETITPLTRVIHFENLNHGKWYWSNGNLYIHWDFYFNSTNFEIVQRSKCIELWTDSLPNDGYRSGVYGIKSRFGLFGHHNGNCKGWRMVDSEFAWNAIDGVACIAENLLTKDNDLSTVVYNCEIHHNYRDGLTNFCSPPGAAGRSYSAWFEMCAHFNYIHSNGGAGVFIHRTIRVSNDLNVQTSEYPFRINNNTIINNKRGFVVSDERMNEVIETFGYDMMTPDSWTAFTYQQKVDYWNSLLSSYDTSYIELKNNNICFNEKNTELITNTWPGTEFIFDSDYNNIFPMHNEWIEGSHSISVDPQFTETPTLSGLSPLVGVGTSPFEYPKHKEVNNFYFSIDLIVNRERTLGVFNIGAGGSGLAYITIPISFHSLSLSIETQSSHIPEGDDYMIVAYRDNPIKCDNEYITLDDVSLATINSSITSKMFDSSFEIEFTIDENNKQMYIRVNNQWKKMLLIKEYKQGVWKEFIDFSIFN